MRVWGSGSSSGYGGAVHDPFIKEQGEYGVYEGAEWTGIPISFI